MTEIKTAVKINAANASELEKQLKEALEAGENQLVINMEDTTYLSSVGLRVFASTQKKINAADGTMTLIHVSEQVLEIFEVTGFVGVLTIE